MRFRAIYIKRLMQDKRGDALFIFIIFLFFIFGMMVVNYTEVVRASIMRQKVYNAVQDGLTLARSEALKIVDGKVSFDSKAAKNLIQKCLNNNNLKAQPLTTWYSAGRIYASGKTAEGTPFQYSIEASKNFR